MNKNLNYDTIIIGAGPAGMMAAYVASLYGKKVLILDKNEKLGRKLRITGKGRCNLCNNCSVNDIIENTVSNGRFLYSALNNFNAEDLMNFFETHGVPLKTERGNRVYPLSDNANDIANLLEKVITENGVEVIKKSVNDIIIKDGKIVAVKSDGQIYNASTVLIATGGISYGATGSTGDGYRFAKKLGHSIIKPVASLVGLCSNDKLIPPLQGLSLKNTKLSLFKDGKNIYEDFGELLFTHFGISGPIVLSASTKLREEGDYKVVLDLKPALTEEQLDQRLIRDFDANRMKNFDNYLPELVPKKLIPAILEFSDISPLLKCHSVTKEQRQKIITSLKKFTINITSLRPFTEAVVTAGGVSVKEVNPKTMESKIVSGLFFAGEVLDLDAYTGGFNLQIAFSTGYTAGENL